MWASGGTRTVGLDGRRGFKKLTMGVRDGHRPGHADHEVIIALQRAAGNAVVVQLLSGSFPPARQRLLAPIVIQKFGTTRCDCPGEANPEEAVSPNSSSHAEKANLQRSDTEFRPLTGKLDASLVAQRQSGRSPSETAALYACVRTLDLETCHKLLFDTSPEGWNSPAKELVAKGSGYFPDPSPMEGGFVDRRGRPLRTLQQYLAGKAPYVSVAMDSSAFPYGTELHIKEMNDHYNRDIRFRVVDTGDSFKGTGTKRIDICVANRAVSVDPLINGTLHYTVR